MEKTPRYGNALDHLRFEVEDNGHAEFGWLGISNAYFRDGDPWAQFIAWASKHQLCWSLEERHLPAGRVQFVHLYPAAAKNAKAGARIY